MFISSFINLFYEITRFATSCMYTLHQDCQKNSLKNFTLIFCVKLQITDACGKKIKMGLSFNIRTLQLIDKLTYVCLHMFALRHHFCYTHINDRS